MEVPLTFPVVHICLPVTVRMPLRLPKGFPKSHFSGMTKDIFIALITGNAKDLKSCEPVL